MRLCLSALATVSMNFSLACDPGIDRTNNTDVDGGDTAEQHQDAGNSPLDNDAFWAADPPPMWCGPDGGTSAPQMSIGGTLDCPDDKNREGCRCTTVGQTAACWPGHRINRNLGKCKDGMTTCNRSSEFDSAWGPCAGYVLPSGTSGKSACKCFSGGKWDIINTAPCIYGTDGTSGAASTVNGKCVDFGGPPQEPDAPWSDNTVSTDCAGHFKLCYTIKAGDKDKPSPSDCVIANVCTEADYTQINKAQKFPPLPAWVSNDTACTTQFTKTGGYWEMSVDGVSQLCDKVKKVFNSGGFCPATCMDHPDLPECQNCSSSGGGSF